MYWLSLIIQSTSTISSQVRTSTRTYVVYNYIILHLPLQITNNYMCSINLSGVLLLIVLSASLIASGILLVSPSGKPLVSSCLFTGIKCFLFCLYFPQLCRISKTLYLRLFQFIHIHTFSPVLRGVRLLIL